MSTGRPQAGHGAATGTPGRGDGDTLRRTLTRGVSVTIFCVALLSAAVLGRSAGDFRAACRDLAEVRRFRLLLDAANGISAERGPANSVMAEAPSHDSPTWHRLATMREANDDALARVAEAARGGSDPSVDQGLRGALHDLDVGRREVDAIAATAVDERSIGSVQHAIRSMFAVSDDLTRIRNASAARLLDGNEALTAPLLIAEMLVDLREHAGRIASEIIGSMATHRPITEADLIASGRALGRLHQIWSLIGDRSDRLFDDPRMAAERAAVETQFFGDGLSLVDHIAEQSRNTGAYDLTASAFTARFVPTLAPIERLRMTFLDVWLERVTATRHRAFTILLAVSGCLAVALSTLLGLVISARSHVFQPLLFASAEVIALAEDGGAGAMERRQVRGEMRRLFDAIDLLRAKMQERAVLTETLGRLADTDGLTGLLNRRALDSAADRALSSDGPVVSLVLIDIDHFKAINDRYGHQAGDEALRRFAALLLAACRPPFAAARFGGEEFAILMPSTVLSQAVDFADGIRAALRSTDLRVDRDVVFRLTASFGVADSPGSPSRWPELVARADAALYRAKTQGRDQVCWTSSGAGPASARARPETRMAG